MGNNNKREFKSSFDHIELYAGDEARWNSLLINSFHSSYRASMSYEFTSSSINRKFRTFIFKQNDIDIAGAHYSLKSTKINLIRMADLHSGIVFKKEPEDGLLKYILNHFIGWAKSEGAIYAKISPWIPQSIDGKMTSTQENLRMIFNNYDFKPITGGRFTYWIDISLSEDQLLTRMEKQTRKRVRQGERSELKVEKIEKYSDENFEIFWSLYFNLGKNKRFNTISKSKMKAEVSSLMKNNLACLFFTIFNNNIIYAALTSTFGDAATLYSAINPDYANIEGCPTPGQYTYWEMIKNLKNIGLVTYDLGFCPGPVPKPDHPAYNIWRFKYDFGGMSVQFMPSYGKILQPITGRVFQYWKYRK